MPNAASPAVNGTYLLFIEIISLNRFKLEVLKESVCFFEIRKYRKSERLWFIGFDLLFCIFNSPAQSCALMFDVFR